ncbi:nicotinate phosphoribosyltransferase [Corynebacterium sanguinis]|uniref:Nicotinate phosphoribosyltransferase n=1 Tax=Corynebacterium sanguinis TaxID=2594913 RepID=A0A6C1TZ79_9CORY|nr:MULTISPECIES: nicotinate phosphoribosyltransferase [Corynebacterium]MBA4505373.1 nicotinate phosphoribosyltransferase [Corynebacterium sanguinis]MCT1414080.1 nicotinate phosphoribosyltransferase [Corynebacterium sanguinis]MCT1444179.1 nicotinate phosphoribosyltransferase [Corynebacterium sanguinis]MCT1464390.1 nicotinate phosphoribosyltransferase [Corynebacterium sanguinis]MCT1491722.1 nicotinate phosphoribosyltransferase [Corynebacterium sanguinis]
MNNLQAQSHESTAFLTDMYELTMLDAAFKDGTAHRRCTFEVFARKLSDGRRYGVLAGIARVLDAICQFRFTPEQLASADFLSEEAKEYLRNYRFSGQVDGYREGEIYFPYSPLLTVRGTFAECVILETVILSILNSDSAVASAASRMVTAAEGRPLIEMGSRRTNERAAISAARAAYIAGFSSTSNLEAAMRYGIPKAGTAAHAWMLLHVDDNGVPDEKAAFASQVESLGPETTLLVDTFDITKGVENALEVAGTKLGAVRIDSGDLGIVSRQVRKQLDDAGAVDTKIIVSSDLDEFVIAGLRSDPVDGFGVGTSVVTGSGAPTAGMVYKLVEVEGHPVAKRSRGKVTYGGTKSALRAYRASGVAVAELVHPADQEITRKKALTYREMVIPLIRDGHIVEHQSDLEQARDYLDAARTTLPWEGLALSRDEPAIPTHFVGFPEPAE